MMTTFWATVDLNNLLKFIELRDSPHAQAEIREYGMAIKQMIAPSFPHVAAAMGWQ
jgi:thymidylate synthase (FAD)